MLPTKALTHAAYSGRRDCSQLVYRAKSLARGPALLDSCLSLRSHPGTDLEAGDSEPASIVREGGHGHHEGAVWDVLIIELDGDFIVTWGRRLVSTLSRKRAEGANFSHPSLVPGIISEWAKVLGVQRE